MSKTTYYIGAGASFHSLPLVNSIPERMEVFYEYVKERNQKGFLKSDFTETYLKELSILIHEIKNSTSIDSYAKELYNRNDIMKHMRLKAILSGFLSFEQIEKSEDFKNFLKGYNDEYLYENMTNTIDKRYRTFWSELTNQQDRVPSKDFNILSWNYDSQFESAYSRQQGCSLTMSQQQLNVYPSINSTYKEDRFSIIKLNGTAGLLRSHNSNNNSNLFYFDRDKTSDGILDYMINHLKRNYSRSFSDPQLKFAWELEGEVNLARKYAKEIMREAEILIVIGYSFPKYNKEIDKNILSSANKLKRIYYQAPASDVESQMDNLFKLNERFIEITKPITKLDSFYNPY